MPKSISSLARDFMQMPLRIEIAPQGTSSENIEQEIFMIFGPLSIPLKTLSDGLLV